MPRLYIICAFQKLNPQAQTAYFYGIGVYVHTKKAILNDGLLFVKEGFLYALTLLAGGIVFKELALFVGYGEFVIYHLHFVFLEALAGAVLKYFQIVLYRDHFI